MLITEEIEKTTKISPNFFKSLRQFSLKFKDEEAIRKQLTVLVNVNNWKNWKNKKKY